MKRLLVLCTLFAFLPVFAQAQQVTFHRQAPAVGTTRVMVDTTEMVMLISVNAEGADQSFDVTQAEKKVYTETILEVDGNSITKRRVAFTDAVQRQNQPMQGLKAVTLPLAGKTYLIDHTADSLVITTEDGDEVSKEEYDKLEGTFRKSTDGQFGEIFDGRTMSVGEDFELTEELMQQFGSNLSSSALKPKSAHIKLLSVGTANGMKTAKLEVDFAMSGTQSVLEMDIVMKGIAEIYVDNLWPLSLVMTGTVTGVGNHSGMPLTADGEMRMAKIATYE